jgi:hypothetical protein
MRWALHKNATNKLLFSENVSPCPMMGDVPIIFIITNHDRQLPHLYFP